MTQFSSSKKLLRSEEKTHCFLVPSCLFSFSGNSPPSLLISFVNLRFEHQNQFSPLAFDLGSWFESTVDRFRSWAHRHHFLREVWSYRKAVFSINYCFFLWMPSFSNLLAVEHIESRFHSFFARTSVTSSFSLDFPSLGLFWVTVTLAVSLYSHTIKTDFTFQ